MQPEYILSQLDRFISLRKLTQIVNRAADSLHAGELEAAQQALGDIEYSVDSQTGVYLHDTDSWLRFLDREETEEFSSGIDELDSRGVAPRRGSMFLIIGAAGEGKSYWLRQIGKHNVLLHRRKVLHITLENDLEETLEYYTMAFLGRSREEIANLRVPLFRRDELGRFTQLDSTQITPSSVIPAQKQNIKHDIRAIQRRGGDLLVKWFPTSTLTVPQLRNYLEVLVRAEGFSPDMLIIDYMDLMHTDERNLRISVGQLARDLRGLAGIRDMALVTATQGNRSSATAKIVGTNMVAEDWSKIGTADTVCTLSRTAAEKEMGLARILVAKARRAKDKWLALITQSYATGQFALDSTFFSKLVHDEVSRVTGEEEEAAE
jgi:KaiC/GvpD/RAD55 family RecA-like ATPase